MALESLYDAISSRPEMSPPTEEDLSALKRARSNAADKKSGPKLGMQDIIDKAHSNAVAGSIIEKLSGHNDDAFTLYEKHMLKSFCVMSKEI